MGIRGVDVDVVLVVVVAANNDDDGGREGAIPCNRWANAVVDVVVVDCMVDETVAIRCTPAADVSATADDDDDDADGYDDNEFCVCSNTFTVSNG